jgi:lysyl-tRNA synthetase class 2
VPRDGGVLLWLGNDEGVVGPIRLPIHSTPPVVGTLVELLVRPRGNERLTAEWVRETGAATTTWKEQRPPEEGWARLANDPDRWRFLRAKSAVLQALRAYFVRRRFLEVETPILSEYEAFDPHIGNARVSLPLGGAEWRGYLQTSPEYEMKMLIAGGAQRIFQFFRAVRAGENTARHHPEFCLLEWYRVGADYRGIMKDLQGLVRAAARATGHGDAVGYRGMKMQLDGRFRVTSFFEALEHATGVAGKEARTIPGLARAVGKEVPPFASETWADYVTRVFALKVQPKLGAERPEFIVEYPAELGTMARALQGRPDLYERAELFIAGVELANGYSELTDAAEQRRRFEEISRESGKRIPERFLDALELGVGECAGSALGVDRLVMILTGAESISDVIPFTMRRQTRPRHTSR